MMSDLKASINIFANGIGGAIVSFVAGVAVVLFIVHMLIAFGEMKSELNRNDDIMNSIDGKLDAIDRKFSGISESQFRMERKLGDLIRFLQSNE